MKTRNEDVRAALESVTLEVAQAMKKKISENRLEDDVIMVIIVLDSLEETVKTEDGMLATDARFIAYSVDPRRKASAIAQILQQHPASDVYGAVTHSNAYMVPPDKIDLLGPGPHSREEVMKYADKEDAIVAIIVGKDQDTKMVFYESYKKVGGAVVWEDKSGFFKEANEAGTVKASDDFTIPLIKEEEFQ